jgi:MFS family permease
MQRAALAWLVLDLTGSSVALGTVAALQFLPILALSLFSGVLADRLPKRPLLIGVQYAYMAQSALLTALTLSGAIQLWQVYALSLWQGVAAALEMPARLAFVSEMVGRPHLKSAVGLNSSVFNGARIVGPGIGGLMIAAWGAGWCFAANTASYVAAVAALQLMRADQLRAPAEDRPRGRLLDQLAAGLRYVRRTPAIAMPLLMIGLVSTFGYNFTVVLPLFARYALETDAVGFGFLNGAFGAGSLLGGLLVAARAEPHPRMLFAAACAFSVVLFSVGLAPTYAVAVVLLVVLGLASITYSVSTNTLLQLRSHEGYRGRVLSLYSMVFAGTVPLGASITGGLAELWGIRATLLIQAGLCLLGAAVAWLYFLRHRQAIDAPPAPT